MRFASNSASRAPGVALTSMLDVIFLLLCFFVTVSVFSQWESEVSISLPSAQSAEPTERLPGEVIVNLSREGVVTVNGAALALADLTARLTKVAAFYPGQPVIVRADRNVRYEQLLDVVDACRRAGVWNFSLATANGEEKK